MSELFRGWRRKLGVVTLLIALTLSGCWGRSQSRLDSIDVPLGNPGSIYGVRSIDGSLHFSRYSGYPEEAWSYSSNPFVSVDANGNTERVTPWKPDYQIDWRWDWAEFHFGVSRKANRRDEDYMLPYWAVILPMTVLSAYLLLSKPAKSNQKKTEEPIHDEGK